MQSSATANFTESRAKCSAFQSAEEGGNGSVGGDFSVLDILEAALSVALARFDGPIVLAVSGGRDSMSLMHALARWAPERVATVATFDHGTGNFATDASSLVVAEARKLGMTIVRERARTPATNEAQWREARWSFLNRVARAYSARVATAHTRDDQIETIVMRVMRGSGARGLAALAAPSPIIRPWLGVARAEISRWVNDEAIQFMEDPTNSSSRFLRGRVRNDMLPAFEAAHPGFAEEMLQIGEHAALWRRDVVKLVDEYSATMLRRGVLWVPAAPLLEVDDLARAVVWPELFARIGVVLDAGGTRELVRFTNSRRSGAMLTLPAGALVLRVRSGRRDGFELRGKSLPERRKVGWSGLGASFPTRVAGFRFRRIERPGQEIVRGAEVNGIEATGTGGTSRDVDRSRELWSMALPANSTIVIRTWSAGDRIRTEQAGPGRRVARYFAEAGIPSLDRQGWPVVLVESEILWVPGVCRDVAAIPGPRRPARPDLIWYRCEREHD